jgi:hypothetical protein
MISMKSVAVIYFAISSVAANLLTGCGILSGSPSIGLIHNSFVSAIVSPSATQGHRLVIAKDESGFTQAGLIGLHVISATPPYISIDPMQQITENYDFTTLDPTWWYPPGQSTPDKTGTRLIRYKVSSTYINPSTGNSEAIPSILIEKVKKTFELFDSIPEVNFQFQYDGTFADYRTETVSASSPIILVDYTSSYFDRTGRNAVGIGITIGAPNSDSYAGGYIHNNTRIGESALSFHVLLHEIIHVLGFSEHVGTNESHMTCGSPSWSDNEYYFLSDIDRTIVMSLWPRSGVQTYSISGQVVKPGHDPDKQVWKVFAVNTENGVTFSALTGDDSYGNGDGQFRMWIKEPGNYRVFAKGWESGAFDEPVDVLPTWYVSGGGGGVFGKANTSDPYAGTVITVSNAAPNVTGINFSLTVGQPPFNFFWSNSYTGADQEIAFYPTFTQPGTGGNFMLFYQRAKIVSLEPYGTNPDYSLSVISSFPIQDTPELLPKTRTIIR